VASAAVDEQAQEQGLPSTGEGALLPDMIRQAVEAALPTEMSDHLLFERHSPQGQGSGTPDMGEPARRRGRRRDRLRWRCRVTSGGTFGPFTALKWVRQLTDFDDIIMSWNDRLVWL
jgi:hypothetical protein